jgi:hypothetical protein
MSRRSNAFGVGIVELPSWADYTSLPPGQFIEFTLNTPQDVGMQPNTLANWCGGDFVPDYGARGGMCYQGGGEHNVWTDSRADGSPGQGGVYVLDCDSRLYVRRCYPAANNNGVKIDPAANSVGGGPTDDWGAYADGSPQSKHTYNCISYMPAAWGGGSHGSLMRVSHTGGMSTTKFGVTKSVDKSTGYAATWRFDLSKPAHSVADPGILKITGSATYDFGNGNPAVVNDASFACIDHSRQGWWSTNRQGSQHGERMVFTSKTGAISGPQGQALGTSWAALHHFADDDIIVRLTDANYGSLRAAVWEIHVWQAGTSNGWVQGNLNRQPISEVLPQGSYAPGVLAYPWIGEMHPRWSSILGCFVGLDYFYPYGQRSTTIRVWKFTPPPMGQRFSGTWQVTWELVKAKPGTEATNFMHHVNGGTFGQCDAAAINGTFGRLAECPSLRAFVWTRDVNKPGQLVRLQGM